MTNKTVRFTPIYGSLKGNGPICSFLEIENTGILLDVGISEDLDVSEIDDSILQSISGRIDYIILSQSHPRFSGGLVYAVTKYKIEYKKIYATTPTKLLGIFSLKELLRYKKSAERFDAFSFYDIKKVFDSIDIIDYLEDVDITDSITLKPFNSGYGLGGTIWNFTLDIGNIVYAPIFNRSEDNHLNSADITYFSQPLVLITSPSFPKPSFRPSRRKALEKLIETAVREKKYVLIPTDSTARSVDILFSINLLYRRIKKSLKGKQDEDVDSILPRLVFMSPYARSILNTVEALRNWGKDRYRSTKGNPFSFGNVIPIHTMEEFDYLGIGPKIIVATPGAMQNGFSNQIFIDHIQESGNNLVVSPIYFHASPESRRLIDHIVLAGQERQWATEKLRLVVKAAKKLVDEDLKEFKKEIKEKEDIHEMKNAKELEGLDNEQKIRIAKMERDESRRNRELLRLMGVDLLLYTNRPLFPAREHKGRSSFLDFDNEDEDDDELVEVLIAMRKLAGETDADIKNSDKRKKRDDYGYFVNHKLIKPNDLDYTKDTSSEIFRFPLPETFNRIKPRETTEITKYMKSSKQRAREEEEKRRLEGNAREFDIDEDYRKQFDVPKDVPDEEFDDLLIPEKMRPVRYSERKVVVDPKCQFTFIDFTGVSYISTVGKVICLIAPKRLILMNGEKEFHEEVGKLVEKNLKDACIVDYAEDSKEMDISSDSSILRVNLDKVMLSALDFVKVGQYRLSAAKSVLVDEEFEDESGESANVIRKFERGSGGEKHNLKIFKLEGRREPRFVGDLHIEHIVNLRKEGFKVKRKERKVICNEIEIVEKRDENSYKIKGEVSGDYYKVRNVVMDNLSRF